MQNLLQIVSKSSKTLHKKVLWKWIDSKNSGLCGGGDIFPIAHYIKLSLQSMINGFRNDHFEFPQENSWVCLVKKRILDVLTNIEYYIPKYFSFHAMSRQGLAFNEVNDWAQR